jgi:hypothetical protein
VGLVIGYSLPGSWRPVGDGKSVVNSRTGEIRNTTTATTSLDQFAGHWLSENPDKSPSLLIVGLHSITLGNLTAKTSVIDSGENWWVVEVNSSACNKETHWRLELSNDKKTLLLNSEQYRKVRAVTLDKAVNARAFQGGSSSKSRERYLQWASWAFLSIGIIAFGLIFLVVLVDRPRRPKATK